MKKLFFFILLILCVSLVSAAPFIDDEFAIPPFVEGNLYGQENWTGSVNTSLITVLASEKVEFSGVSSRDLEKNVTTALTVYEVVVDYDFNTFNAAATSNLFEIEDGTDRMVILGCEADEDMRALNGGSSTTIETDGCTGIQIIRIVGNDTAQTYDVYLNGVLKADDFAYFAAGNITQVHIYWTGSASGSYFMDNLCGGDIGDCDLEPTATKNSPSDNALFPLGTTSVTLNATYTDFEEENGELRFYFDSTDGTTLVQNNTNISSGTSDTYNATVSDNTEYFWNVCVNNTATPTLQCAGVTDFRIFNAIEIIELFNQADGTEVTDWEQRYRGANATNGTQRAKVRSNQLNQDNSLTDNSPWITFLDNSTNNFTDLTAYAKMNMAAGTGGSVYMGIYKGFNLSDPDDTIGCAIKPGDATLSWNIQRYLDGTTASNLDLNDQSDVQIPEYIWMKFEVEGQTLNCSYNFDGSDTFNTPIQITGNAEIDNDGQIGLFSYGTNEDVEFNDFCAFNEAGKNLSECNFGNRVVCSGDSNTIGSVVGVGDTFCTYIDETNKYETVNEGQAGKTSEDIRDAYLTDLIGKGYDTTILMIGTNDLAWNKTPDIYVSVEDYYSNLLNITSEVLIDGQSVVIMTVPPCNDSVGGTSLRNCTDGSTTAVELRNDIVRKVSFDQDICYVDIFNDVFGGAWNASQFEDGVHFNISAHELINESLMIALEDIGDCASFNCTANASACYDFSSVKVPYVKLFDVNSVFSMRGGGFYYYG